MLEMYLQGVSTRKAAAITEGLSRVRIGKDAVSRVAQRLEEELSAGAAGLWSWPTPTSTWTRPTSR